MSRNSRFGDLAALELEERDLAAFLGGGRAHRLAEVLDAHPVGVLEGHEGAHQRRGEDAAEVADDRLDRAPEPPAAAPPSATGPGDLVVAEALAPLDRPAEEGDPRLQPVGLDDRPR